MPVVASSTAILVLLATQCRPQPCEFVCGGRTMGTSWSLHTMDRPADPDQIQSQLDSLESIFSTWNPESEISRFNRHPPGQPFAASVELAEAYQFACVVHHRSGGVFDPTVGPLTAAYGFGPPSMADPTALPGLASISFDPSRRTLRKDRANVTLDLSALVEGLALDRIAANLEAHGYGNFLLEIGGELLARGPGPAGQGWPAGVQDPGAPTGESFTALRLRDEALSTSGTYVQNVARAGKRISHIIDPRTRQPIAHDTVSVSVIAPTAIEADAWATALLVLGAEAGRVTAEQQKLEALFLKAPPQGHDQEAKASSGVP